MSYDAVIEYIQQSLPFTIGLERRIRFSSESEVPQQSVNQIWVVFQNST